MGDRRNCKAVERAVGRQRSDSPGLGSNACPLPTMRTMHHAHPWQMPPQRAPVRGVRSRQAWRPEQAGRRRRPCRRASPSRCRPWSRCRRGLQESMNRGAVECCVSPGKRGRGHPAGAGGGSCMSTCAAAALGRRRWQRRRGGRQAADPALYLAPVVSWGRRSPPKPPVWPASPAAASWRASLAASAKRSPRWRSSRFVEDMVGG